MLAGKVLRDFRRPKSDLRRYTLFTPCFILMMKPLNYLSGKREISDNNKQSIIRTVGVKLSRVLKWRCVCLRNNIPISSVFARSQCSSLFQEVSRNAASTRKCKLILLASLCWKFYSFQLMHNGQYIRSRSYQPYRARVQNGGSDFFPIAVVW